MTRKTESRSKLLDTELKRFIEVASGEFDAEKIIIFGSFARERAEGMHEWTDLDLIIVAETKLRGYRVIAIGTTVVRALEHAAAADGRLRAGFGLATQRLGPESRLRVVDAILSGTHEAGTSHYELLRAFLDDETLRRTTAELDARGYLTHEFGDSVLIERAAPGVC